MIIMMYKRHIDFLQLWPTCSIVAASMSTAILSTKKVRANTGEPYKQSGIQMQLWLALRWLCAAVYLRDGG